MKKTHVLFIVLALLLLITPVFLGRLHDDEVLKWQISKNTVSGKFLVNLSGGNFMRDGFFPIFFVSPFLLVNDHIFIARIVSLFFTLGSAYLLYYIAKIFYDEKAALASFFLFILSFHTLRFGYRFMFDQYGLFFLLLTLFLLLKKRFLLAGVACFLMIFSRVYWIALLPFFLIYLVYEEKENQIKKVGFFIIPPLLLAFLFLFTALLSGFISNLNNMPVLVILSEFPWQSLVSISLIQSWVEVISLNILTFIGLVFALEKKPYSLIVLSPILAISLIPGFIVSGGTTHYILGLQGVFALVAGNGLFRLYQRLSLAEGKFIPTLVAIILIQFLGLSIASTHLSYVSVGVQDWGFWQDQEVIDLLEEKAKKGDLVVGVHGAFVENVEWRWAELNVEKALDYDPDWFIIYPRMVKVENNSAVECYSIPPYLVIHSVTSRPLNDSISVRDFKFWRLR